MTAAQLKQLEKDLWEAADQLRANSKLTASEYTMPILGLIFLRHASNRFDVIKAEVEPTLPSHPTRGKKKITADVFWSRGAIYLPEKAHYDYLVSLPDKEDIGEAINKAMRSVEEEQEYLKGVLPKTYNSFEKPLLLQLLRIFNNEALHNATDDVFGKIYEYFLNEFAMKGAQEGGEFFTPVSLVSLIVNFIEPLNGIVFDPACGSFGMVVQTGNFLRKLGKDPNKVITIKGQEKTSNNTNIAKMNLAVHGLDGEVLEGNTFYEDKHSLVGKCQFVMANPPFNVDKVDKERDIVKKDPRLPFGLPKNDNANYLWIQYFYAYLNNKGRAGFVMASSASDAGHSERLIRQKLVETHAVDIMVSISNNFFYTRSLPCTLWFYDKAKASIKDRKDKVLMLDARKVFRKVSTTINDFSPEQLENLTCIAKLYRGENEYYKQLINNRIDTIRQLEVKGVDVGVHIEKDCTELVEMVKHFPKKKLASYKAYNEVLANAYELCKGNTDNVLDGFGLALHTKKNVERVEKVLKRATLAKEQTTQLQSLLDKSVTLYRDVIKELKQSKIDWVFVNDMRKITSKLSDSVAILIENYAETEYQLQLHLWLLQRFPNGKYNDVQGLCKVVTIQDIADKDYSLSPGRYVGVDDTINDNEDWRQNLQQIHKQLATLNIEAIELANTISSNYKTISE